MQTENNDLAPPDENGIKAVVVGNGETNTQGCAEMDRSRCEMEGEIGKRREVEKEGKGEGGKKLGGKGEDEPARYKDKIGRAHV